MKLLLSRKEAAQTLSISVRSVDKLTASGQLQSTPIGRGVRYHVDTLEKFAAIGSKTGTRILPQ